MSVISLLSSEDEDDECVIINYDEEQTTLLKSHTVMIVVDDDDKTNNIYGCLPELEKEMKPGHLEFRATEQENSEDPFALCSEFDVMDTGNKEGIPTVENTLLNTNVKPVCIEDIAKNTTVLKTNNEKKVIKPTTDDSNFFMDTRKEISTVEKNNLTECCKSLNSAQRDENKQIDSFNKRLAERLALLIKGKAVQTCNSSRRDEHLVLGKESKTNVDDIINKVSKSSFHVDGNIYLLSKQNGESNSKNKIVGMRRQKTNIKWDGLNFKDIEGSKSNKLSTENESNEDFLEHNECEPCEPTTKNNKKRSRKRTWRKHPKTKLNGSSSMSSEQGSNVGDINQFFKNNSMQESSDISTGHSKKEDVSGMLASVKVAQISHDLTQQTQAHWDSKSSTTNLDQKTISGAGKIKEQSLVVSKTNCEDCIQNTTANKAINQLIENVFKNSPLENKKANNNHCHRKLSSPPNQSLTPPHFQSLQCSGKNCLGDLKEKQDTDIQKPNAFSTVCETLLNCQSPKKVVAELNDSNESEVNAYSKLMNARTTESIASKQFENNFPCFQQEKYTASSGNMTTKGKEKSVNVTEGFVSSVHCGRDLQDKGIKNTTIDSNISSDQNSLNQISTNSQLKTYTHYYNLVFDDNGECLCMKMGDRILLTAKEARLCKSRIVTAEKFTCQQLKANEVQLAKTTFFEALQGFQTSFVPLYSKLMEKIIASRVHVENNEQFTLLILTWFLKMYLRVTTLAPEFMDCHNEIKTHVRALILSKRHNFKPIIEIFFCNEAEFESKCFTVVQYMHSIFNSTQNFQKYECNGREEKSLQFSNEPTKNVHEPETSVHIAEQGVNIQSMENNVVVSKPIYSLEKVLRKNDISVIVKNNKALELHKLNRTPYNCNEPTIEKHQDKSRVGESNENESIARKSRLNQLFENAITTSLSRHADNLIHTNEAALQPRSTFNYHKQQTQLNTSGDQNSSQDNASVFSINNTHNTRDQELMQHNLTERGRPISQTVTSTLPLPFEVRLPNNSAAQCANQYNRDISNTITKCRYQDQMPSGMSSDGSRVSYSSSNNNVPFEPQLHLSKCTREVNRQLKRKFTDSERYFTKRHMAYRNDIIYNKWEGKYNKGDYQLNHFQPSLLVNNSQFNPTTYTTPDQIRPISLNHHIPAYFGYHHRSSSYQYGHASQNYSQPNSCIRKPVEGQSASSGCYQFQGDHQGSKSYENCVDIHNNNNHYSLKVKNSSHSENPSYTGLNTFN